MSILSKREIKHPGMVRDYPKVRGFYKPQRAHLSQPMPVRETPRETRKAA